MIPLDTNVISELLKRSGDASVLALTDAQIIETRYLAAISLTELRAGIAALTSAKQRESLLARVEKRILSLLASRILATSKACATHFVRGNAGGGLVRR